jgi:hypothetical protein
MTKQKLKTSILETRIPVPVTDVLFFGIKVFDIDLILGF